MPSKFAHPSLTTDGWSKSSLHVADQMLSDFFLSEYSQTFMWADKVRSFPWFLQRYADDPDELAATLQANLKAYYEGQFTSVDVEVTSAKNTDSINVSSLSFFMTFSDSTGEVFNLSRMVKYSNMKIVEINNILTG